jgi:hypothetical protein
MPIELLVPIVIFVVGVIVATMGGGLGLQRLVEGQRASGKNLTHTQAYEAPFQSGDKK